MAIDIVNAKQVTRNLAGDLGHALSPFKQQVDGTYVAVCKTCKKEFIINPRASRRCAPQLDEGRCPNPTEVLRRTRSKQKRRSFTSTPKGLLPTESPPVDWLKQLEQLLKTPTVEQLETGTDAILTAIKSRAIVFVGDNFENAGPRELLLIENAMMIGASIVLGVQPEEKAAGAS